MNTRRSAYKNPLFLRLVDFFQGSQKIPKFDQTKYLCFVFWVLRAWKKVQLCTLQGSYGFRFFQSVCIIGSRVLSFVPQLFLTLTSCVSLVLKQKRLFLAFLQSQSEIKVDFRTTFDRLSDWQRIFLRRFAYFAYFYVLYLSF